MNFYKSRHYMYDIHMHIIPSVDDGSWSLSMSDSMLEMARRQGIRKILATPHSSAFDEEDGYVGIAFHELKEHMKKIFPDMELYLGSEVCFHKEKLDAILDKLNAGIYPSLNGTKYVLTEFSTRVEQEEAIHCTQALFDSGWIPVIAHTERYRNLFGSSDCIKIWKDQGALLQINVFSVFEECNLDIKRNAVSLIESRAADFLGSDGHRMNHRPPSVEYGLNYLYDHFDEDYVDGIAFRNAEIFLKMGEPVSDNS